ncbi:MqnA/MqnD/SBP family protein [uncultured Neglectibacter sp.]|uniref:PhnD/SsuA/transferrin family substrate-binding protein n=1 Tax=uncultured Neglectibacter sp. TaxID=1924108 RepID=UPI0034DEE9FD
MKKLIALTLVLMLCLTLSACGNSAPGSTPAGSASSSSEAPSSAPASSMPESEASQAASEPAEVAALKGPTAMGMVQLMEQEAAGDAPQFHFEIAASADELTPRLVQGTLDIAAVPANLASVLYNNTEGKIRVLAVNTLGVLYLVESGDTVHSVEDLRGKTVYSSGKGSTPEYALTYMLSQNGIDPETDVTIEWKSEHSECVAALAAEENAIAMLPQPFVTTAQMKNENIRVALDLTKEWENLSSTANTAATLITGVVVARAEYVEENPEQVADFLSKYEASVKYVTTDIDGAAALVGKYDIVPEAVAKQALPQCNITFLAGEEMREKLSAYLQILFEQNPKAIGGAMPGDDFYYLP